MYKNKIVTLYQGAATWVGRRAPTRSTPGVRRSVSRRSPVWTSSTADSTRSPRPTCRPVTSPSPAGRSTHVQTGSPTARHGQSGSSHYLHMAGIVISDSFPSSIRLEMFMVYACECFIGGCQFGWWICYVSGQLSVQPTCCFDTRKKRVNRKLRHGCICSTCYG